jgi:hypothetical protein
MHSSIKKIFNSTYHHKAAIVKMPEAPLENIPFHQNTPSITRFMAAHFPLYIAVHDVSPVIIPPEEYTQPHIHPDADEINIIISKEKLVYKIQLGEEYHIVNSNSNIWIPRGTLHAANVLSGSGYFITLLLN